MGCIHSKEMKVLKKYGKIVDAMATQDLDQMHSEVKLLFLGEFFVERK